MTTTEQHSQQSRLYVVATPLGNLADLSSRACEALTQADLWLVEDTRVSHKIQSHLGLKKRMISCFDQKEHAQAESLMKELSEKSESWCILSDAGTPAVSDPGSEIVNQALNLGIHVIPVPGPSALISILSVCGFKQGDVIFLGFAQRGETALVKQFETIEHAEKWRRVVFFESPHRIESTLESLLKILTVPFRVALGRELTKMYEQIVRGSCQDILAKLQSGEIPARGEFVCALEIPPKGEQLKADHSSLLVNALFKKGLTSRDIFELSPLIGLDLSLNQIRKLEQQ